MKLLIEKKYQSISIILFLFPIFLSAFRLETDSFDFYYYYIVIILLSPLFFLIDLKIDKKFLLVLLYFLFVSFMNVIIGNVSLLFTLKQIIAIAVIYYYFYMSFKVINFNVLKIFKIYILIALTLAIINIVIFLSSLLHIEILYDLRWFIPTYQVSYTGNGLFRAHSILQEPSHFCKVMAPAVFISIYTILNHKNYFLNKKASFIIILSILLSFSSIGFLVLMFSILIYLFVYKKHSYRYFFLLFPIFFFIIGYITFPDFQMRVYDTYIGLFELQSDELNKINLSSYVLVNHLNVGYHNFLNNPIFGAGLGSHGYNYEKYAFVVNDLMRMLNKDDASSLLLRVFSELGLIGLLMILLFIKNFSINHKYATCDLHVKLVNNASLLFLLIELIRGGNYIGLGVPFFIWMYYFSYKKVING